MLKGDKMRMLRLYKKIRQQDVADGVGISRNYLSMLENEKKPITEEIFRKWIDFLNSYQAKNEEELDAIIEQVEE